MAEVKITDLVPQQTIDEIKRLDSEITTLAETYANTAREMAKGLKIDVKVMGDIDKINEILSKGTREATALTEQLNVKLDEQGKVIANTTNTIQRQLMERERLNKAVREEYRDGEKVKSMIEETVNSYKGQTIEMAKLEVQIKKNKDSQKALEDQYKKGEITQEQYIDASAELIAKGRELALSKSQLSQLMKIEEKLNSDNAGSYNQLSHQLELLKRTYKDMSDTQKDSDVGREFERAIQDLDAHLKDLAADMGEFQRNVGNYAIAGQNGVVSTESLVVAINQQALTLQDVADQSKILLEARNMLDTNDAHYAETVAMINGKLDENRKRLADVSDIMDKEAKTAAEAEEQNKRLKEALRHIDVTSEGAQQRIKELNSKIERNKQVIDSASDSTENLASKLFSLIGVNQNFASSLTSLQSKGNVWEGLGIKVKAFGKTLTGLLANPWVLAFLGIGGAVAAVKWWYEYNKGLERASLLTKNFTKLVGDDMRDVRTKVQTLADTMGKGFDETIGAANVLAKQFGISWNETLDIMKDGVTLGADLHGNMVENINKYAGAFKDAGIAADEFMAILVNTKDGLFDEKALKGITDAGMRIRNMSEKTQKALEDIGISGQKMQDDLEAGNITMVEAIQQVTDKLQELPPNAQEVGSVMVNVFGKKSAMAGEEVIQSISDINTNLSQMKSEMSDVQKLNAQQIDAQNELNATIAAMFDMTGGGFEEMTKSAKLYMTQGLTAIIKGCVDIANWFIRIYNNSAMVRRGIEAIGVNFKVLWSVVKNTCKNIADQFSGIGKIIEGVFTLDADLIKKGVDTVVDGYKNAVENIATDFVDAVGKAHENIKGKKLDEIEIKLKTTDAADQPTGKGISDYQPIDDKNGDSKGDKGDKEAEKAAKEELKRLQELEDAKIAMMADGHEKEIALIRQKFKKKMDEIKGDGETETALRIQLAEQCQKEIADCEEKYQKELSKINLENRLASVKEGSREELDLKLAQLEANREAELKEAEKTGADVLLINEKFDKQKLQMQEDFADNRANYIMEQYAIEEIARSKDYSDAVNKAKKKYSEEMALAKGNYQKQEQIKRDLDKTLFELDVQYGKESAEASIKMIEDILAIENLSAEDRLKWEQELTRAKIALFNEVADAHKESVERQVADDERLSDERLENLNRWLSVASDVISQVSDSFNTFFDSKIERLEADQEANTAAGEEEQARISELVEKQVITEEEGEARKRAAEAQTAKKNEELEKKKAQLQYKQAVFQKAVDVAQAGINTALGITQTIAQLGYPTAIPFIAIAGAMGAIQIATILATPIPKYAKGTDYHKGGPALVGDGGRQELVIFNGGAWLTPDKPTLVDMPKGAQVLPDANDITDIMLDLATPIAPIPDKQQIVVNNDYSRLEQEIKAVGNLIRQQTKMQRKISLDNQYELFKSKI